MGTVKTKFKKGSTVEILNGRFKGTVTKIERVLKQDELFQVKAPFGLLANVKVEDIRLTTLKVTIIADQTKKK